MYIKRAASVQISNKNAASQKNFKAEFEIIKNSKNPNEIYIAIAFILQYFL